MTLDDALRILRERYGDWRSYVSEAGTLIFVVNAEPELRAIPSVPLPKLGIGLLAREVKELAQGRVTVEALVRRKNPELFQRA
ncbi:MAG TPA: hypothetical protein VN841_18425 [Bryobacteraceae bacterium]|nr:hypothetical protein [Bryobacteraceae bacterium]